MHKIENFCEQLCENEIQGKLPNRNAFYIVHYTLISQYRMGSKHNLLTYFLSEYILMSWPSYASHAPFMQTAETSLPWVAESASFRRAPCICTICTCLR